MQLLPEAKHESFHEFSKEKKYRNMSILVNNFQTLQSQFTNWRITQKLTLRFETQHPVIGPMMGHRSPVLRGFPL